jgi:hypothetical protein
MPPDLTRRANAGEGLGSTTMMGLSLCLIQPLRSAEPILPAPNRAMARRVSGRCLFEVANLGFYACPAHSSTAAATASSADLPPHRTNWNAG